MANFQIQDAEGNNTTVTIPDFALDSTNQLMLANIKQLVKGSKDTIDSLKDVVDNAADAKNGDQKGRKKQEEATKKLTEETRKNRTSMSQNFKNMTTSIGKTAGGLFGTLTKGVIALGSVITGVATTRFVTLGQALTELTKQGLSQRDVTITTITSLNQLGFSTNEAVQAMLNSSRAFAVNTDAVLGGIRSLQSSSRYGQELGMTLNEVNELAINELSLRSRLMNLTGLTAVQQGAMNKNILKTATVQVEYSQALGVSTDTLRTFVSTLIEDNGYFAASMLRLSTEQREKTIAGVSQFASIIRATAGEAGGEITAAIIDAAQGGAIGFSDAAVDMIAVLPRLAGTFNDAIKDFDSGFGNAEQIALQLTDELANLSDSERERVFLLARAGDEQAKAMARAVLSAEQAATKLGNLGLNVDDAQKAMLAFTSVTQRFSGMFDGIITMVSVEFGKMIGEGKDLENTINSLNNATTLISQSFTKFVSALLKYIPGFTSKLEDGTEKVRKFSDVVDTVSSYITGVFDSLTKRLESGESPSDIIMSYLNPMLEKLSIWFDGFKETMKTKFNDTLDYIADAISEKMSSPDFWEPILKAIAVAIAGVFTLKNLMKLMKSGASVVGEKMQQGVDKVKGLFGRAPVGPPKPPTALSATANAASRVLTPIAAGMAVIDTIGSGATMMRDEDNKTRKEKGEAYGQMAGLVTGGIVGAFMGPAGAAVGATIGGSIGSFLGKMLGGFIAGDETTALESVLNTKAGPKTTAITGPGGTQSFTTSANDVTMSALNNIVTKLEDKSYKDAVNNDTGDDDLRSQIADFLTAHKDNLEKEGTLIQELRNQATSENPAMNGQAILDELKAIRKATKGTKEAVS